MLETLVADLTDVRLWLLVLLVSAVGLAEKLAIYHAGQRTAEADLSSLPGVNEERRARLETMFQYERHIQLIAGLNTGNWSGDGGCGRQCWRCHRYLHPLGNDQLAGQELVIVILSGQLAILF